MERERDRERWGRKQDPGLETGTATNTCTETHTLTFTHTGSQQAACTRTHAHALSSQHANTFKAVQAHMNRSLCKQAA